MDTDEFISQCKTIVADYAIDQLDKSDYEDLPMVNVYVVWSTKVLQNNKALLSTNLLNGMYYEITYNGDKDEIYFDAYKKWENKKYELDGE